jgi:hypothetical protein
MLNKALRNHANILLYSIRLPTIPCKFSHLLIDIRISLHSMPHGIHMFRFMITLAIPWLKPTHPIILMKCLTYVIWAKFEW